MLCNHRRTVDCLPPWLHMLHSALRAFLSGKSWPEIAQPFPELPCLWGCLINTASIPAHPEDPCRNSGFFIFLSFLHSVLSLLFIKPVSNGFVGCLHATGAKPRPPNSLRVGRSAWLCCGDAAAVLLLRGAVLGPQPSPGEGAAPGAHSPCQH